MMNDSVFGPDIPEDDKPTVTKVIEKMASLWEQKKNNRVKVLQHWRLMRMCKKMKLLKEHNHAYMTLFKLSRKPLLAFYLIKQQAFGAQSNDNLSDKIKDLNTPMSQQKALDFMGSGSSKLGFDSMMNFNGISPGPFMMNSGKMIQPISEIGESNTSQFLPQGTQIHHKGDHLIADGKGNFLNSHGVLIDFDEEELVFLNSRRDPFGILSKDIKIEYEGIEYLTDGKGGLIIKGTNKAVDDKELIQKLEHLAKQKYIQNIVEENEKLSMKYQKMIDDGIILPAGENITYSGKTLVSDGKGGFMGPMGLPVNLHGIVKEYLNGKVLPKSTVVEFKKNTLTADGNGRFYDKDGKDVSLCDETVAILNSPITTQNFKSIKYDGKMYEFEKQGSFKNKEEIDCFIPDNINAIMLASEGKPDKLVGMQKVGKHQPFGRNVHFNGDKLTSDGRGGFIDKNSTPVVIEPEIEIELNEVLLKVANHRCIYKFGESIDLPLEGIPLYYQGTTYISDGSGGFLYSDKKPAFLSLAQVSWMNGYLTSSSQDFPEKGETIKFKNHKLESDGKGRFTDKEEESSVKLPEEDVGLLNQSVKLYKIAVTSEGKTMEEANSELERIRKEIEDLKESISRKDDQLFEKKELLRERDELLNQKTRDIRQLETEIEKLNKDSSAKSQQEEDFNKKISILKDKILKKEQEVDILKEKNTSSATDEKMTTQNLQELKVDLNSAKIDLKSRVKDLDELRAKHEEIKTKLSEKEGQIKVYQDRNKELTEKHTKQISNLNSTIKDKESKVKDLASQVKRLNDNSDRLTKEKERVNEQFNKTNNSVNDKKEKIDSLTNEISKMKSELKEYKKIEDNLNKEKKKSQELSEKLEKSKEEIKKTLVSEKTLKTNLNDLNRKLTAFDSEGKKKDVQNKQLISEKEKQCIDEINNALKTITNLQKSKDDLERELSLKLVESEKLRQEDLKDYTKKIEDISKDKLKASNDILEKIIKSQSERKATEKADQNKRKETSSKEIDDFNLEFSKIKESIVNIKGVTLQNDDSEPTEAETQNSESENSSNVIPTELLDKIVGLRVKREGSYIRESYDRKIDNLSSDNYAMKNKLKVNNNEIYDLKEMNQTLQNKLEYIQTDNEARLQDLINYIESRSFFGSSPPLLKSVSTIKNIAQAINDSATRRRSIKKFDDGEEGPESQSITGSLISLENPKKANNTFPQFQALTSLRKARILNSSIIKLFRGYKLKAFYSIYSTNVKNSRAKFEASLRLKGRLLVMMSQRYSDSGVKKSFYRWWVATNQTYVRDCITKIALTARLTDQTAVWRFKKLVSKKLKMFLPEATKKMRLSRALALMQEMITVKDKEGSLQGFNLLRPDSCSPRLRALFHCLKSRVLRDRNTYRTVYDKLKNRKEKQKGVIKKVCFALDTVKKVTFSDLRKLNSQQKSILKERKITNLMLSSIEILQKKAKSQLDSALKLSVFQSDKAAKNNILIQIAKNGKQKQKEAFKKLMEQMRLRKLKDQQQKKRMLSLSSRLRKAQTQKQSQVLNSLLENKKKISNSEKLNSSKKYKFLRGLISAYNSKQIQSVDKLILNLLRYKVEEGNSKSVYQKRQNMKNRLVSRLIRVYNVKVNDSFNLLDTNKDKFNENDKNNKNKLRYIITMLQRGAEGQIYDGYKRLTKNMNSLTQQEEKDKYKQNRLCNILINKLANGLDNAKAMAYFKLKESIQKIKEEEEGKNRKIKLLISKLTSACHSKQNECLKKIYKNSMGQKQTESQKQMAMKKLIQKMKQGCDGKSKDIVNNLRRLNMVEKVKDRFNTTQMDIKLNKEMKMKYSLLKNLIKAHKVKNTLCINHLKHNMIQGRKHDDNKHALIKKLIDHSNSGSNKSKLNAYMKMIRFSRAQSQKNEKINSGLKNILKYLSSCNDSKKRNAFTRLILHKNESKFNNLSKNDKLKTLFNRLIKSQRAKSQKILEILKNENDNAKLTKNQKRKAIQNMMGLSMKNNRLALMKAYLRLKDKSEEEKLRSKQRDNSIKNMISKLKKAQQYKSLDILSKFRANSVNISNKLALKNKALNLFMRKLSNNGVLNLQEAYNVMKQNSNSMKEVDTRLMAGKRSLLNRLANAQKIKQRQVLESVKRNSLENRVSSMINKQKSQKLINRLIQAQTAKQKQIVNNYQEFLEAQRALDRQKAKKMIGLMKGQDGKLMDAFSTLRRINQEQKLQETIKMNKIHLKINALVQNQENRKRQAYNSLRSLNQDMRDKSNQKRDLLSRILKGVTMRRNQSVGMLYQKMKDYSNQQSDRLEKQNNMLKNIIRIANFANNSRLRQSYNTLRNNNLQARKDQMKLAKLASRLISAHVSKKKQVLGCLNKNRNCLENSVKKMVKYLSNGNSINLRDAMSRLRDNRDQIIRKEKVRKQALKFLCSRLDSSSIRSRYEALNLLTGLKKRENYAKNRSRLPLVLHRRVIQSKSQTFSKIKLHFIEKKQRKNWQNKTSQQSRLFYLMENILKKSKRQAYDKIKRNSQGITASSKLSLLFNKCSNRYEMRQKDVFGKLTNNVLQGRMRDLALKKLFLQLKNSKKQKSQQSLTYLQKKNYEQKVLQNDRNNKLAKLTDNLKNRLHRQAHTRLNQNNKKNRLLSRVFWTANSRINRRFLQKSYDKFLFFNTLQKRGRELAILSNLTRKVSQRYQDIKRQAFANLVGGERKAKIMYLAYVVQKLILLRKQHAFDSIFYLFEFKRRDFIREAIINLIRTMDRLRERRVSQSFNQMKINNPWFKRIITIMTLKTPADTQIAFWRLKYQQNIGETLVAANHALAVKQILRIFNRKTVRNLTWAFWRVDQGNHTPANLDVSFAVMPNRRTPTLPEMNGAQELIKSSKFKKKSRIGS